jgi:DNA polymerase III delta subunit
MTQLAYLWGEDAWAIDHAAAACATELAAPGMSPLATWRVSLDDDTEDSGSGSLAKRRARLLDEVASRLGTATLFGDGTLVVLRQPGGLLRETASRERTLALLDLVAPGNALCVTDLLAQDARDAAAQGILRDAIGAAGGLVRQFPALDRTRMETWLGTRATELGVRLGPGAAQLLAQRVGAHVREGDVDRRRQSELANGELEKLALYRPGGEVTREDVEELVPEAIPGSVWAFLDAVAARRGAEASLLATRLTGAGTPLPVIVAQVHRRVRELVQVREHLDSGTRPPELVRIMRLQPFRAQKLAEQAATWDAGALDAALLGLVELDLRSKGISLDGGTVRMDDEVDALGLQLWIAEHAAAGRGRAGTRPAVAGRRA